MVVDPPNGWVQNANDAPWLCTYPPTLRPADFPSYFPGPGMGFRPQRSVKMLLADESISFEELVRYKHSTHMELAERLADDLIAAARQYGDEDARDAAEVLEQWDLSADGGSEGGQLFVAWYSAVSRRGGSGLFAEPWDPAAPLTTPDGLRDPEGAAQVLGAVAAKMRADFGTLAVPWGEVARLRSGDRDLPASGGPGGLGIFRVLSGRPDPDGRFRVLSGDSFVAAVEFSDPVRAQVLLSYGNSSQPGSPHVGDQLELLSQQRLRPAWRTRAEVEAHRARGETVDLRFRPDEE